MAEIHARRERAPERQRLRAYLSYPLHQREDRRR